MHRFKLHRLSILSAPAVTLYIATLLATAQDGGEGFADERGRRLVAEQVDFARDVYPLLGRSCLECHGLEREEGGLRLDNSGHALDSGTIQSHDAADSELIRRLELPHNDPERMPAIGKSLTAAEISILRRWIDAGAPWPSGFKPAQHWAYVAARRPTPPQVGDDSWSHHPLDRFVLDRLHQERLWPSPPAVPESLLRRVYLDLIGLPPTPQEVLAFVSDPSDRAYAAVVDDLLQRPQFGERWARPWLDLARYADSHGFQRDDLRDSWAYRDWVIAAINEDLPFDQFTIQQLAGDLLPDAGEAQRIATGFHRCAPTNVEAGSIPEETRIMQVIDRVNTTATVWLGTTLECAQCHDHKYDPLTTEEYYQLFAFFNQTEIEADLANPNKPSSIAFIGPTMPLGERQSMHAAEEPEPAVTPQRKKQQEMAAETTLVMVETAKARPTHVLQRGDYRDPGDLVLPGTPAVLHPFRPQDLHAGAKAGVADRLSLAKWLVDPANPLVARVTVNRWWGEIFGRGLVETAEDFGIKGEAPTHPELLDHLALELVHSGWSMKHVLRLIVTSATYRQSSRISDEHAGRDDQNRLLARGPRLRLDAEAIRDNALAISGLLNYKLFGPPIRPYQPAGLWTKVGGAKYDYETSTGGDAYRRGVYVVLKRGSPYPSFMNFDASSRLACSVNRSRTNTPLQALTLLNDPVYVEMAKAMAREAVENRESSKSEIITDWFRRCTARAPDDSELGFLLDLFETQLQAAEKRVEQADGLAAETAKTDAPSTADDSAWYSVATTLLNLHETVTKP